MRIIANEPLITKRTTTARRAMTLAVALFFFSVLLSTRPTYILPAYGVMLVGIILLNWGGSYGGKWLRRPRVDELLAKALKGLNHGSRLYAFFSPADQVLVSPVGLFVLTARDQYGRLVCQQDKWSRPFSWRGSLRALTGQRLGNPTRQAEAEAEKVRRFVASGVPGTEVPVQPVLVFVDPRAELEVTEPTVPVLALGDLKAFLRDATARKRLPAETAKAVLDLFDEQAA